MPLPSPLHLAPVALTGAIGVLVGVVGGLRLPGVDEVIGWLSGLPAIIVLPLITVTGETVVLAAVAVAVEGGWSLAEVVAWCFLGTVASDVAWFGLARVADDRWRRRREPGPRQQRALAWMREHTGERPYLALLVIKFLYGSRFLMLVYLATRRVSLRHFLLYDAIGTAVWLAVLVPLGWLLARGLVTASAAGRLDLFALALVGVLVAWRGGVVAWRSARARRPSLRS